MDTMYIVVPCYNESAVLEETNNQLIVKIKSMIKDGLVSDDSRICYVNDGSSDKTWEIIKMLYSKEKYVCGISLSRNQGHQNALLAGILTVKKYADMVISLDADLQDDINVIDEFVKQYYLGNDVVYGVRSSREKDTFFKKFTAEAFYKTMKRLGANIVFNHADYRLMSKRSIEGLEKFDEVNLFLRGIVPLIGFPNKLVSYERKERFAGESKYPFKKMVSFAFEGITSFSIKPIRFITLLGFLMFLISVLFMFFFIVIYFTGETVSGGNSMVCSIWMLGGLQLLSIGLIGEYIGKSYLEIKNRPKFIVEEFLKN